MSTDEKLETWLGQEINVELHEPRPDNPRYTAFIEEFAIMGEGDTLNGAIATLFASLQSSIESFANAADAGMAHRGDSSLIAVVRRPDEGRHA